MERKFLTLLEGANKYLPVALNVALESDITGLESDITDLQTQIDALSVVGGVYSKAEVDGFLALKADKSTTYTITEVDGLLDDKAGLSYVNTQLATKADLTYLNGNFYTKTEINDKLSSVYKFMGSVPDLDALYALIIDGFEAGYVYNVVENGKNYAFLGGTVNGPTVWDDLGGFIDLSNYATNDDVTDALNDYYTKTESDNRYVQSITINGTSVGVSKANGVVNLDLSSYLTGATAGIISDITALTARVTTLEGKVSTLEGNITTINGQLDTIELDIDAIENEMVTGAKFNGTDVTKTGNELLFSTVLVEPTPATMTLATLNASHGDKPIGFMLYCTNVNLMTKYVKIGASIWSVEPIFLAQ